MRRSPIRRLTPLRNHTQLKRKSPLRGTSRLSPRRTILQSAAITRAKRGSGRARPDEPLATWCQARIEGVCTGRAEHRHHVLRRSAGGGDEAANTLDVCSADHRWIHDNPAEAYARGFLRRRTA